MSHRHISSLFACQDMVQIVSVATSTEYRHITNMSMIWWVSLNVIVLMSFLNSSTSDSESCLVKCSTVLDQHNWKFAWVVVSSMRKLRSVLPPIKSRVVYKITWSWCLSCYVCQTDQHVSTRFKGHIQPLRPIRKHISLCGVQLDFSDKEAVLILQAKNRSIPFLKTLEEMWQRELKPHAEY